ncbi:uncharacterized protein LOC103309313 [Acyrthosiphon pisum]|uniref:HAT C-terminal dimerisation domain-containing protein n=1 Tax=Acyrthosiphon pisum TaxID=7029 RepID=A0A8R2JKV9_ACYPI|nr:uncharacterized protein LOC103309313 [Acyrthosiphon pisum]
MEYMARSSDILLRQYKKFCEVINMLNVEDAVSIKHVKKLVQESTLEVFADHSFFVKSTTRWKILMDTLKISLKGHSDTRWASKAQAVKAMNSQIKEVFKEIRDTTMEDNFTNATKVAEELQISTTLKESRTKKRKRLELYETDDDMINISAEQNFRITIIDSIDILLTQMTWRLKYNEDINTAEIVEEIKDFKHAALSILPSIELVTFLDLLQMIHDYKLKESHPNIEMAIRIFLSIPVTTASCERSFSKLKLIKTYLRSTMAEERLSSMAILSIETEIASKLDYEEVIDKFADTKARKISL